MRIQTLPYADLLVHGDEGLLLRADDPAGPEEQGGTIARLSAIGVAVLQLAVDGIDLDSLANALEARFGAPPDQTIGEALASVLAALEAEGLVHLNHELEGGSE